MAEITLAATTGRKTGSRSSNRLRAEGRVPATVYGLSADPVTISVDWRELRHCLITPAGLNALIDLSIDGSTTELVIVKTLQRHPVRRNVMHADFLRVSRDTAITVDVPLHLEGETQHLIEQLITALSITAKPAAIPDSLSIDVSKLRPGDVIRVSDVDLPADVETHLDPEEAVLAVRSADELMAEEPAEGEGEAAEGEEAGAEDGEGAEAGGEDEE